MKKGKIIPNGVIPKKHEYKTILLFTEMGIDVELIPKNNIKGMIDLRHTKRHQAKCLRELEKQFINKKSIKRLKIITKSGKTLDFEK